jgi:CheY-like chemotaxis protein
MFFLLWPRIQNARISRACSVDYAIQRFAPTIFRIPLVLISLYLTHVDIWIVPPANKAAVMRILVVEDHVDSAILLARVLRAQGHDVRAVGTGADALDECSGRPFDLMISDIGLPDVDGWHLLSLIRQRQPIRAIALTAFTTDADQERSRAAGFDAHLPKPLCVDALVSTLAGLSA